MSYFEAIVMGLIQGITEFLPVSSSGHLAISRHVFGLEFDNIVFDVLLHFGTLIAIIAIYYKEVLLLIKEGFGIVRDFMVYIYRMLVNKPKNKIINNKERKFVMLIIIASIPTAFIGILLEDIIINAFNTLLIPGIGLLLTGSLLYITNKINQGDKAECTTTYRDSFVIGFFQGLATLPGISRSGSTIVVGLFKGLNKEFAVKFSFIMSLPAILGATLFQLRDITNETFTQIITAPYIIGMAVATLTGYICIKTLIRIIKDNKLHYFAYYCWGVGTLCIIVYFR